MIVGRSTIDHITESLKSTTISQEASSITHNPSIHTLAVESFRKPNQSLGMCMHKYAHMYKYFM